MRQRGRGVFADGERRSENHLNAAAQSGVHVFDPHKAARAKVSGHESEMIGRTVGTGFGGEGMKEVENRESAEENQEGGL